jgi:ribonucleoside-diphosphate reductase beta chain
MSLDSKIFNTEKTDYSKPSLLLGEQDAGLFDTVNKSYPEIWKRYKSLKSLDWDENEFDYSSCNNTFKTVPKHTADKMIKTLAWQWEADSVAAKSIYSILAPFISSPELNAAEQQRSANENVHSATYSEIVRMSFDNPRDVLDEILSIQEAFARLEIVGGVFSDAYKTSHKYALGEVENNQDTYNKAFMMYCALLALEGIQFMSSFAVTFSIVETGVFMPIGKAVQKIAQDEVEEHVELNKSVLLNELSTERGKVAFSQNKDKIKKLIDEVVDSEFKQVDYLYSDGNEEVGINADLSKKWTLWCAKPVYEFFGLESAYELPQVNPLKFMNKYLDISATQASPQEQDNGQYRVNMVRRGDENVKFDIDF